MGPKLTRRALRRAQFKTPEAGGERAKKRAVRFGIKFSLKPELILVPARCPALGIQLVVGETRAKNSPSLDRIDPIRGYVVENVRVLSDHANRLKGDLGLSQLRELALAGPSALRGDYGKLAAYVDREMLLLEVRAKARQGGRMGGEWEKIARFLEGRFRAGLVK